MAGGIDWFRWHHGSVTDPKFGLIAKKAGVRVGDVIAVWAMVLESASGNEDRGVMGQVDAEAIEFLLGMEDGMTYKILDAMTQRGLIGVGGRVESWEKRQPKRERDTDNSADRTRAYRERQKQQSEATENHVTQCDASERQKNARGEESREEEKREEKTGGNAPRKRSTPTPAIERPDDVDPQTWADWLTLRKAKKAPVTETVVNGARSESVKAGIGLDGFLKVWCRRGSQGLEASWLNADERSAGRPSETPYQRSMRERMQEAAPEFARKDPSMTTENVVDFFAIEVPAKRLEIGNEPSAALG